MANLPCDECNRLHDALVSATRQADELADRLEETKGYRQHAEQERDAHRAECSRLLNEVCRLSFELGKAQGALDSIRTQLRTLDPSIVPHPLRDLLARLAAP